MEVQVRGRAGVPATVAPRGTFLVTTAPAPTSFLVLFLGQCLEVKREARTRLRRRHSHRLHPVLFALAVGRRAAQFQVILHYAQMPSGALRHPIVNRHPFPAFRARWPDSIRPTQKHRHALLRHALLLDHLPRRRLLQQSRIMLFDSHPPSSLSCFLALSHTKTGRTLFPGKEINAGWVMCDSGAHVMVDDLQVVPVGPG